ncbi:MAG TPA: DUF4249 domain-containing protein [Sphingobacterium sp.]|nr:DUF4249 domain-containing protein [Sphingobacterium sp.]
MKRLMWLGLLIVSFFVACEEIIHVDLNAADPRYVIEAELTNLSAVQTIRISQTVSFDSELPSKPINDAQVMVRSSRGRTFAFHPIGNGYYRHNDLIPRDDSDYLLTVDVGGEEFSAVERMRDFVPVDSLGALEETIFNETSYSILVKFTDPRGEDNYYKYLVSVNGQPFRFLQALNDKYNDGLYVTHQLLDFMRPFALGDSIVVRRQSISKPVFDYWNEVQMINPGSAAPANPKSNISNGAFGYFSISNTKEYGIAIRSVDFYNGENE